VRVRLALWLVAALLASVGARAEVVRELSADLFLERSGAFRVVERIRYDFGDARRHGIYRDIPLRGGEGFGEARSIAIDVEEVTDEAGRARPWKLERGGGRVHLRIGDPDRTVTGLHEYRIRYRVRRAFRFLEDRDELAWNVTGNEWKVPIERAEARVYLPEGAERGRASLRCFSGSYGSTARECTARDEGDTGLFEARGLAAAAGLTLVVALPKGALDEPSRLALLLERWIDAGGLWLLAPCAVLLACFRLWRVAGRDPDSGAAIPVRYEPPAGLSPAEVGTLVDERADLRDLSATLLDLAVRGYLEIQEVESPRFLLLSSKDYLLKKRREADDVLRGHERAFHGALFAGRDAVRVSSLRQKFHAEVERIRELVYEGLSGPDGCFASSPQTTRRRYLALALAIAAVAIGVGSTALIPLLGVGSLVACAAIVALFAPSMPRRTRRGRALYEEILGYREFLLRVDRDRLERLGGRTTDRFEQGLAYALVLGAADAWADAFADLYAKPPDWYRSDGAGSGFRSRDFVSSVGRSLDTIGRTLAESPPSSGGSGGGGGGGGFSGGGSGGGGGGSW